jgi:hypothetical protein
MRLNRFTVGIAVGAVCVIAILAFVLTGKGGDANLVSGSAIADAAGATERVPGANVSMRGTFDVAPLPKPLGIKLDGVQDFRGGNLHIAGEYTSVPTGAPGVRPDGTVPMAMVSVDRILYMKSPLLAHSLPDGKDWVRYDVGAIANRLGFGSSSFGQTDPKRLLAFLRATSDRVERVGTDQVRGVQTTHYRATVELRKYPDALPVTDREQAKQSIEKAINQSGLSSFPMEVWIDDHHLLRRMSFDMKGSNPTTHRAENFQMQMELFGFGRKRAASAPPADQTVDISKLRAGGTP